MPDRALRPGRSPEATDQGIDRGPEPSRVDVVDLRRAVVAVEFLTDEQASRYGAFCGAPDDMKRVRNKCLSNAC